MLIRLILYIALAWGIYYALSGLFKGVSSTLKGDGAEARVDDVMQRCPECETYFPSREGLARRVGGERRLFCGDDCAGKFAQRGGPPAEGEGA